jgi:NitT/TauT family transport system ATP-binding protein
MFQEAALFPWLTVEQNVGMPMRLRGRRRSERAGEVGELLELVRLDRFAKHRPHQLSGGMRQRVALARALAQHSEVLLMDEPFGAVDAITRDLLHEDLVRVRHETGVTILFVTHSVREATRLGDRIVVLSSRPGRVLEEFTIPGDGSPAGHELAAAPLVPRITEVLRHEIGRHGRG